MECASTNYRTVNLQTFENFRDIKIIIFDFDFTLYKGLTWEGYDDFFMQNVRKFFSNLSEDEYLCVLNKNSFNLKESRVSENFARVLANEKGSTKELVEFLKTVKYPTNWQDAKLFPEDLLNKLSKKYQLFILSNSSKENIEYCSKCLGFNLSYFSKILSNQFDKEDLTKSKQLKDFLVNKNIQANEILMVGDSIKYDLEPAYKLGMQVLLMED